MAFPRYFRWSIRRTTLRLCGSVSRHPLHSLWRYVWLSKIHFVAPSPRPSRSLPASRLSRGRTGGNWPCCLLPEPAVEIGLRRQHQHSASFVWYSSYAAFSVAILAVRSHLPLYTVLRLDCNGRLPGGSSPSGLLPVVADEDGWAAATAHVREAGGEDRHRFSFAPVARVRQPPLQGPDMIVFATARVALQPPPRGSLAPCVSASPPTPARPAVRRAPA